MRAWSRLTVAKLDLAVALRSFLVTTNAIEKLMDTGRWLTLC